MLGVGLLNDFQTTQGYGSLIFINTHVLKIDKKGRKTGMFGDLVSAFDIEIGFTFIYGAFRLGFSPGEFADFLLGWATLDIAGDDGEAGKEDLPEPEAESSEE